MKRFFSGFGVAIIVIVTMVVTVPDSSSHFEALESKFKKYLDESNDNKVQTVFNTVSSAMAKTYIRVRSNVKNYGVASVTTIEHRGDNKLLSIGAFGYVLVVVNFDKILNQD